MKHLVIIPTYNEAENIEKMIKTLFNLYPKINVLVVDDSSPDGTSDIVEKLQTEFSGLFILKREKKSGLAQAYINGFKKGMTEGFELFTQIDADFSHNPEYISKAIDLINSGYDVVCGSRYIRDGYTAEKNPFKKLISIVGNLYVAFMLGKEIEDWTGGFNTYTRNALEKISFDKIDIKGYVFQVQMKYMALKSGCKIKEFPIRFTVRKNGKSKMNLHIILEAFISVLKIKFNNIKNVLCIMIKK